MLAASAAKLDHTMVPTGGMLQGHLEGGVELPDFFWNPCLLCLSRQTCASPNQSSLEKRLARSLVAQGQEDKELAEAVHFASKGGSGSHSKQLVQALNFELMGPVLNPQS